MKSFAVFSLVLLSVWQLITGFQLDSLVLDTIDQTKNAFEDEWIAATQRVTFSGTAGNSPPKNKFNMAMAEVEVGIREASQFYRGIPSTDAKSMIQKACNSKSYSIARHLFGHFIYNKVKAPRTSSRGKREASTVSAVKSSIAEIKAMLGDVYDKMQNLDGRVTLAFAIDTTGSMWDEINSAKKIARYVIDNVPKKSGMEVEYVLAPFNDPHDSGTLPAKAHDNARYFGPTSKDNFLAELDDLPVTGGGDCKEMLYKGISDAWTMSPTLGSPIFVFTDAGVKVKHLDKEYIAMVADTNSMPIYFFLSSEGCIDENDKKLYEEIAEATKGQAIYFRYDSFLSTMGEYTVKSMTGGSEVPVLPETSPASASRKEYSIVADDNMDTLNLAATLYRNRGTVDVKLYRPDGSIHDVDKTDTGRGSLYMIKNPVPGKWKLTTSSDDYYVTGKTSAKDDISFRCFFPFQTKLGRKTFNVKTGNPVIGVKTNMTCEIQAHKKTQAATLKMQIVKKDLGSIFFTVDLEKVGSSSMFQAEMTPPSSEFRLILEGKTKKGIAFKRKSSSVLKPTKAYMYAYASSFAASKTRSSLISFAAVNYGSPEWFDVKVIEAKKFAVWHHKSIFAMKGRTAMFGVSIKAPSDAISNQTHHLAVRIVGRVSGFKASHHVQLLIE